MMDKDAHFNNGYRTALNEMRGEIAAMREEAYHDPNPRRYLRRRAFSDVLKVVNLLDGKAARERKGNEIQHIEGSG